MKNLILLAMVILCLLPWFVFGIETPSASVDTQLSETKVNSVDNAEMVLIPTGKFLMGISEKQLAEILKANPELKRDIFACEMPQRNLDMNAYYIYKNEVTVAQYRTFCDKTNRKMPTEPSWKWQDNHPMVNVSWNDAKAYADWAEVSLPTEAQWEKAARGEDARIFPWGNVWDAKKCCNPLGANCPEKGTSPVGNFPAGASPFGVNDMTGNAWEWCADWYSDDYYKTATPKNPMGPLSGSWRVLRGGSWRSSNTIYFRTTDRGYAGPVMKISYIGFRCAINLPVK